MSRSLDLEKAVERFRRSLEKVDRIIASEIAADEPQVTPVPPAPIPAAEPAPPVFTVSPPEPILPAPQEEVLIPVMARPQSRTGRFLALLWLRGRRFLPKALAVLKAETARLIPRTQLVLKFLRHHLLSALGRLAAGTDLLVGRLEDTARFSLRASRQLAQGSWALLRRTGGHGRVLGRRALVTGGRAARFAIMRTAAAAQTTGRRTAGWYRGASAALRGQTTRWVLEAQARRARAAATLQRLVLAVFAAGREALRLAWTFTYAIGYRTGYFLSRPATLGGLLIAVVSFTLGRTTAPLSTGRLVNLPAQAMSAAPAPSPAPAPSAEMVGHVESARIPAPFMSPALAHRPQETATPAGGQPARQTQARRERPPVAGIAFTSRGRVWRKPVRSTATAS